MANPRDRVSLEGMHETPVTVKTGGTITYDAAEKNGHALAGVAAIRWSGDYQVDLVATDEQVDGVLMSVEPDGKAVCVFGGFVTLRQGATGGAVVRNAVVGDTVAGLVKNLAVRTADDMGRVVATGTPDIKYRL